MFSPLSVLGSRLSYFFEEQPQQPQSQPKKHRILVLGYGWGSRAFTQQLDRNLYDVTVMSPMAKRLNQPSMIHHMKATYTEPPSWLTILEDKAIGLDITKQQVQGSKKTYAYDSLVIATGSEAHDFGVPGVKKHCLMCKTGEDIEAINAKEKARGAFVLGAGPTGVELACKLWSQGVQVKLVEAADTILPGFSQEMQRRVTEYLEDAEIQVLKGQPISAITDKEIVLKNNTIPYSSDQRLIWTCGIKPEAFVRSLTGGGALVVNEGLCYKKNVYAIGDAIKGHGPPTAQNAVQQGTYLADQFNQKRTGGSYTYREKGRVLDLSHCMFVEVFGTVWYVPYLLTDIVRMALK